MMKLLSITTSLLFLLAIFMQPNQVASLSEQDREAINLGVPVFYGGLDTATQGSCISRFEYPEADGLSDGTIEGYTEAFGQAAYDIGKQYGIPYEAILAQSAHESAWGQSGLTENAFNFFGIKAGSGWEGPVYTTQTWEVIDGEDVEVEADFRAYDNPYAGFRGYADFIVHEQQDRYGDALNHPDDPYDYIQAIFDGGYATDPAYVEGVSGTIERFEEHISENNLFSPSSAVEHDSQPPPPDPTGQSFCETEPAGDFVHYLQCDDEWADYALVRSGPNSNMCQGGCGPASIAMVLATMYDESITPVDVADYSNDNGYHTSAGSSWQLMENAPIEMSNGELDVENFGSNLDNALNTLDQGGLVIATGRNSPPPYTEGGHIIVIRQELENGNFLVGDPALTGGNPVDHEYTFEEIDNGRQYWGVTQ